MIAEINDIILVDDYSYIISNRDSVHLINNDTDMVKNINPIWQLEHSSCEWEGFRGNVTAILYLCNFKKAGMSNGIFLSENNERRLIYFTNATLVELDCPTGKIRDRLIGLHTIPLQCELMTNEVRWPAKLMEKINIKDIIEPSTSSRGALDLTHLPLFTVNNSNPLHNTIKTLIDKLPTEDEFTFAFEDYDLSLEEVQSYSIIAQGVLGTMVIINTILIVFLYLSKIVRKTNKTKSRANNELESGLRKNLGKSFNLPRRDSLHNYTRTSIRRMRKSLARARKQTSRSSRSSNSSIRSSVSRNFGRKAANYFNNRTESVRKANNTYSLTDENKPTMVSTDRTTNVLYPQVSGNSTPQLKQKKTVALKAY